MSANESITSLPEAVAALGALPMPVAPAPQALPLSGPVCSQAEARAAGLDIAPSVEELDAMASTIVAAGDPLSAEVSLAQAVPLLGAAITTLRARVAELESDLALANGVLEDVARARRDTCPCAGDRPHQVGCPRDGVPVPVVREREPEFYGSLHHSYRVGHDLPETGGTR